MLDPTTVLFMLLLFTAAMASLSLGLSRTLPVFMAGLGTWALSLTLYALSTAGLLMEVNRTVAGAVLNNAAYLLHVMLVPVAIAKLFQLAPRWTFWLGLTALVWLGYAWAANNGQRDLARILVMGLTLTALLSACLIASRRALHSARLGNIALLAGTLLWIFAAVLRIVELFRTGSNQSSMLAANNIDVVVYLIALAIAVLVTSVGLFLVATEIVRDHLSHIASHDALTGILTRRGFFDHAAIPLAIARRNGRGYGLAMIDVDHFKSINDQHGHAGGDEVLRAAAAALQSTLRGSDAVGRLGGEEFVVLMPQASLDDAVHAAERLREALEQCQVRVNGHAVPFTASFGVAVQQTSEESIERVLQRADEALYAAKAAGRNRVIAANPAVAGA